MRKLVLLLMAAAPLLCAAQFRHNLKTEKFPWTSEPQIEGESFRFMVLGDLTGGEEPGFFNTAIARVNDMSPDFFISVGDLINGYTKDRAAIDEMWGSFNSRLSKLELPFFHVPGNHDVANEVLTDEWNRRLGTSYYAFNVGKNLFLVVDDHEPGHGVSKKQGEYMRAAIEANDPNASIFVFSHAEMWEKENSAGYSEFMPELMNRNTTYFCGHSHRYQHNNYKGQNHYMLAGTAEYYEGRNKDVYRGAYNTLMHVTVKNGKATVANICLDGLLPADIVTNNNIKEVNMVRRPWAFMTPTVARSAKAASFLSYINVTNSGTMPFNFKVKATAPEGYTLSTESFEKTIDASSGATYNITLTSKSGDVDVEEIPEITYTLEGWYDMGDHKLSSTVDAFWTIDNVKDATTSSKELKKIKRFGQVDEDWDWSGMADGALSYAVYHDAKNLYCHLRSDDDKLLASQEGCTEVQDMLRLVIASDTTFGAVDYATVEMVDGSIKTVVNGKQNVKGITAECKRDGNSLDALVTIPRKLLVGDVVRLNFGFKDLDDPKEVDPSRMWWKPVWGGRRDYPSSGIFILK